MIIYNKETDNFAKNLNFLNETKEHFMILNNSERKLYFFYIKTKFLIKNIIFTINDN